MKLISLNMEGLMHLDLVENFIKKESPEFICLQEAPESFAEFLEGLGYQIHFAPVTKKNQKNENFTEGTMSASIYPTEFTSEYFYRAGNEIMQENEADITQTNSYPYITSKLTNKNDETFFIVNTHFPKSYTGEANDFQKNNYKKLAEMLRNYPTHIICGDFNIPRGYNTIYEELTKNYTDEIPSEYKSSLDRNLHKHGPRADQLDQPIFDKYMVDYIFSKPEYEVSNVRLQFGVSDHSAVIAEVNKK